MDVRLRAHVASVLAPTRSASKARLLASVCAPALLGALSLATSNPAVAECTGAGAPTTTETKCLTAIQIAGNPLRSFDISWVNPIRGEYYLGDRSNAGIDVISTQPLRFQRTITTGTESAACPHPCSFVGIKLNPNGTVNNNLSGPDGVTSHGRWLYAGDGNSTLKVIDLNIGGSNAIVQSVTTGGSTRLDERP